MKKKNVLEPQYFCALKREREREREREKILQIDTSDGCRQQGNEETKARVIKEEEQCICGKVFCVLQKERERERERQSQRYNIEVQERGLSKCDTISI